MNMVQLAYLKRMLKKVNSAREPMYFWFLRSGPDGEPYLLVEKKEDVGNPKWKDARAKSKGTKLAFEGTVVSGDDGSWVFTGEGNATPRQVKEDFRGSLAKESELSAFGEKLRGATIKLPTEEATGVSLVAMQKARLQWLDTRKKLTSDLNRLVSAVKADSEAEDDELAIIELVRDTVLKRFDARLIDKLDEALNKDGAARAALNREAAQIIDEYRAELANHQLVGHVDANHWVPLSLEKTLDGTLKKLARSLKVG